MRARTIALLLGSLIALPASAQRPRTDSGFVHRQHDKLFPTCEGCHAGVVTGDPASTLPDESQCRTCHNGTDARVVAWRPTPRALGLLRFSHPQHAQKTDSAGRQCATCHALPGDTAWMHVGRAPPETCAGCHTHRTTNHLAETNRCETCHVPLVAARGLSLARVAALPRPPSHERSAFASDHGRAQGVARASCAVCHARESCASCHVNAATLPDIRSLEPDARVAALTAGRMANYPVPADHQDQAFPLAHGVAATRDVARCGSCHARPSCLACHTGGGASRVIAQLPMPTPGGAGGVELQNRPARLRTLPPASPDAAVEQPQQGPQPVRHAVRVHPAGYQTGHAGQAASGVLSCSGCHAQRFCSDCHAGENRRRFHPANFVVRHSATSYGRETSCASCHNTEAFCRDCHRSGGLASSGRLDVAFHTAQPQWLLQHGRAARQGMESCASCHQQKDCMTCHSTIGWGVNPHGRDFNADRMAKSAGVSCGFCHLAPPRRRQR
jgi:hypothetical protein